jgi:hypothetical protein
MSALPLADLYELGSQWFHDPLMQQDVWPLTALGFNAAQRTSISHASRLKYLAKLTAKARVRMKVTTPLGECHRPSMLGDCQYRYACLSCTHHRVTEADIPQLTSGKWSLTLNGLEWLSKNAV